MSNGNRKRERNVRYQPDERPPGGVVLGCGVQLVVLGITGLVAFPTIVIRAAGESEAYLSWAVFCTVAVSGVATMLQASRLGRIGAGYILTTGPAAAFIGICVTALVEGGPGLLAVLVILTADTGYVETRQTQVAFLTEFENSDRLGVSAADNYELLVEPFEAGPGVTLPVGGYGFRDVELLYEPRTQRRFSGELKVRLGGYFNGSIRSVTFSRGRLEVTPQLSVEPTVSVNWIDTPHGACRADLAVSRVTYTFTPRMFFGGLSNNLRLRWEYIPGSELFVVYTDERFADPFRPDRSYGLRSRGLVVKVNRLFRL